MYMVLSAKEALYGKDSEKHHRTKKKKLRPFKPNRVYLEPLNLSNVGDCSWSWILKDFIHVQIRKRNISRRMSTSSIKRRIGRFQVVVVQWTKKCTKKRDARAELHVILLIIPIVFWRCRCRCRRSCLVITHFFANDYFRNSKNRLFER